MLVRIYQKIRLVEESFRYVTSSNIALRILKAAFFETPFMMMASIILIVNIIILVMVRRPHYNHQHQILFTFVS